MKVLLNLTRLVFKNVYVQRFLGPLFFPCVYQDEIVVMIGWCVDLLVSLLFILSQLKFPLTPGGSVAFPTTPFQTKSS